MSQNSTEDLDGTDAPTGIEDTDGLDLDGPDGADETDGPDGPEGTEPADGTRDSGQGPAKRTSNRALIRKVAAKTVEVSESDDKTRAAVAALLSSTPETVALTTAIMSADRTATQPVTDLNTIADAEDPFEAPTIAAALGRDRIKAVWSLLKAFGASPDGEAPASTPKAATALARKVFTLDSATRSEIDSVVSLMRKN